MYILKAIYKMKASDKKNSVRPRLHEQIKQLLFEQIRQGLLHTDQEFEQSKEVYLLT